MLTLGAAEQSDSYAIRVRYLKSAEHENDWVRLVTKYSFLLSNPLAWLGCFLGCYTIIKSQESVKTNNYPTTQQQKERLVSGMLTERPRRDKNGTRKRVCGFEMELSLLWFDSAPVL